MKNIFKSFLIVMAIGFVLLGCAPSNIDGNARVGCSGVDRPKKTYVVTTQNDEIIEFVANESFIGKDKLYFYDEQCEVVAYFPATSAFIVKEK